MPKKIIYIAGYGRSGSTILDIMLSNSKDTISAGALSNILDWIHDDNYCSCGSKISECPFWADYTFLKAGKKNLKHKVHIQKRCERYLYPISHYKKEYVDYINYTYNYVGKRHENIIDSSKTSYAVLFRPYLLKKYTRKDVKIIFLKRKIHDVLRSNLKRPGSPERAKDRNKTLTAITTIISYLYTYFFTYLIYLTFRKKSRITIKFNNLKKSPVRVFRSLGEKFDMDVKKPIQILENDHQFDIKHMLGGNRIRFNDGIGFRKD